MSFRGRGGGGFRGGRGGGGFRGGRGGRGGGRSFDQGPPERVVPFGNFSHPCQEDLVVKSSIEDVPYFNAPVYLENKQQVQLSLSPCYLYLTIIVRLAKLTRSSAPSGSTTCQSNPQMTSRPRASRPTSSCSLIPPSCCLSQGFFHSLPEPRR